MDIFFLFFLFFKLIFVITAAAAEDEEITLGHLRIKPSVGSHSSVEKEDTRCGYHATSFARGIAIQNQWVTEVDVSYSRVLWIP